MAPSNEGHLFSHRQPLFCQLVALNRQWRSCPEILIDLFLCGPNGRLRKSKSVQGGIGDFAMNNWWVPRMALADLNETPNMMIAILLMPTLFLYTSFVLHTLTRIKAVCCLKYKYGKQCCLLLLINGYR